MSKDLPPIMNERSRAFRKLMENIKMTNNPVWIGVDWAKGSGMVRGDTIKKDENVSHVRFKTVEVDPDGTLR